VIKRVIAVLGLAIAAPAAQAEALDINLSGQTLRATYAGPLSNLFPRLNGLFDAGVLYGDADGRNFMQAHGGLLVTGDAGANKANVTAGLGGRIAVLNDDDGILRKTSGGALALGGMAEARLPAYNRIGAVLYAYGAPKASAFGDLEGYLEYAIGIDYQVLRDASLYLGYRQLKVDVQNQGETTVDNGWHLGLRLNF
jgi:hypothetical protein